MAIDTEANFPREQNIVQPTKSWKGYIWDTWELPSDERWLLFKLDAFVLTFASVSYFYGRESLEKANVSRSVIFSNT
jgi:hypothetical protein